MTNNFETINDLKIPGEAKVILKAFEQINFGEIEIFTPEKMLLSYKGKNPGPKVDLVLKDWLVLTEVLNKSDIGLAETYIKGRWESKNISGLIELAILNEKQFEKAFKGNLAQIIYYRLKHEARENSLFGSKQNIKAHYDLGNSFYQLWLDKTMTYSSALYKDATDLETAQLNKYQSMLDLINPKSTDHILEVGCGWGGFLEYAGKKGYKVTGITISEAQFQFAKKRIEQNKLSHLVEVKLCDYRELNEKYDHAVSIEMIEAVGEKYWPSYFELYKRVLHPNGRFAVQAILISDDKFEAYRKSTDFIQQYVFPGGMLLSTKTIKAQCIRANINYLGDIYFGIDYAKTLNEWEKSFSEKIENVKDQGFDNEFIRLWTFYLKYCEGAFLSKRIDVVQFLAQV